MSFKCFVLSSHPCYKCCAFIFRLLKLHLFWKKNTDAELQAWLDEYFESKQRNLYQDIENQVERLKEAINNNGEYIID